MKYTPEYKAVLDKQYRGPLKDLKGELTETKSQSPDVFLIFADGTWAVWHARNDMDNDISMEFVRDIGRFEAYQLRAAGLISWEVCQAQQELEAQSASREMEKSERRQYERLREKFEK